MANIPEREHVQEVGQILVSMSSSAEQQKENQGADTSTRRTTSFKFTKTTAKLPSRNVLTTATNHQDKGATIKPTLGFTGAANNQQPPLVDVPTSQPTTSISTTTNNNNLTTLKHNEQYLIGHAWERGYQSLCKYKEQYGNCHVPYRYEGDSSLGTWTARQRKDKSNLLPLQIKKLEAIGFTWESSQDRVWMEKFLRLKAYFAKHGNSCVPTSYKEDMELGEWTAKQRQKFTQGRLSKERQQLLNTVGFVYRINKFIKRKSTAREDKKWWEQLERLIQFLLEHGHTLVPFQYAADKSLGRWVNEQRCQNMRGLLRQDRKDILTNLGFVWKVYSRKGELKLQEDADDQAKWAYKFRQLVEYNNEHNSFDVPTTGLNAELGVWAQEQKQLVLAGEMDEMSAQRFAAIGFCTAGEQALWDKNYQALLTVGYTSIYTLSDPCLAHWVICQRYLYKKGQLSDERKSKLFEVNGFSWDSSPINLPKPEPKHILKAKKRQLAAAMAKPFTSRNKKQKKAVAGAPAKVANPIGSDDCATASESEGDDSPKKTVF